MGGELARERLDHAVDGKLGRGVTDAGRLAVLGDHRACGSDGAAVAGLGHDLGSSLVAVKDGDDVEVHNFGELLGCIVQKGRALGDSGVVDDCIETAHVGCGLRKGLGHGLERGEIAGTTPDLGVGIDGCQLLNGRIGSLLARAKDSDGGTLLDKTAGDGIADTARASGDDCFLALEQHDASILRGWTYSAQRSGSRNRPRLHIGER